MTLRRLAVLIFAALLVAITWLRSPPSPANSSQLLTIERLDPEPSIDGQAEFRGVWHLHSANDDFGGYSALIFIDGRRMLAGSDRGRTLLIDAPDREGGAQVAAEFGRFSSRTTDRKFLSDLESLTRDPATGRIWAGYEGINTIERVEGDLTSSIRVQPVPMQEWPTNSGPEAMVRLQDGRFVVLSEGRTSWGGRMHPALLFESDPVLNADAQPFSFVSPDGYRPVDAVQIPDGRVLILLRSWTVGFPLKFSVRVVLADPDEIVPGKKWRSGKTIARVDHPAIAENYEGIAVETHSDGTLSIWLISDDNRATQQRTLMLKLGWDPRPSFEKAIREKEKARE